jgi:hypothetical protein
LQSNEPSRLPESEDAMSDFNGARFGHNANLHQVFCPPGSDPIEKWVHKIDAADLNPTTKAIAWRLAWQAYMHGAIIDFSRSNIVFILGMNPRQPSQQRRILASLNLLEQRGLLRQQVQTDLLGKRITYGVELIVTPEVRS